MTEQSPRPFLGIKPKQAIIIVVLIGVLGFLIFGQDDGAGDQLVEDANTAETSSRRPTADRKSAAADAQTWIPNWPEVELEQAVSHNPFVALKTPADAESPAVDQPSLAEQAADSESPADANADEAAGDAVAEFQSLGVSMIFRNQQKICAVIGERMVQEGDVIDGVRVVAITATEVIVEPANQRPE